MTNNQVIILSDHKGVGKTTALQEWVKQNKNVSGFLSPIIDGKRMFQNIETGVLTPMETASKDLVVGKYAFDANNFQLIEKQTLEAYIKAKASTVVIDEVGPLEINKQLGFHNLILEFKKNSTHNTPKLLFVVRISCVEAFKKAYSFEDAIVYSLKDFKEKYLKYK